MRRRILISLLCVLACRSEKATLQSADTTVVAVNSRQKDSLETDSLVAAMPVIDSTSRITTDTSSVPAGAAPEKGGQNVERTRDSAIAFARGEANCAKAAPDSESAYFHGARPSREFFPDFFCFSLAGSVYALSSGGVGARMSPGQEPYPFMLSVDNGFDMSFVGYRVIGNRIYFLYEITDSEDGAGRLEAVDKTTLRDSWSKPAGVSFNISDPLMTDSAAYMTGINMVGKLRLSDGGFIWKHVFLDGGEKLPLPGMIYNSFDSTLLEKAVVRFVPNAATSQGADALVVDDKTGAIVSPAALKGQKPICPGTSRLCQI